LCREGGIAQLKRLKKTKNAGKARKNNQASKQAGVFFSQEEMGELKISQVRRISEG